MGIIIPLAHSELYTGLREKDVLNKVKLVY